MTRPTPTSLSESSAHYTDGLLDSEAFRAFRQGCPDHETRRLAVQMIRGAFEAGRRYQPHRRKPEPERVPPARLGKTALEIAAAGPARQQFGHPAQNSWTGDEDE